MDLQELRDRLTLLDGELLALIAERQRLSTEVARVKRATGHPTRDFQREREVLLNARAAATKLGLPPALADKLLRLYAETVIPQAGLALESSIASYETGAVDFLSVLTNFSAVLDFEMNYTDELRNLYLATARLEESTGKKLVR